MTITNKFPDIKLQQPVSNWQVISTDRTPVSVLPIAVGQQVFCSDGHLGWITHLLPSRDGWIGAFVIQTRGWWRRRVVIPIDRIHHIDGENVYLSVTKTDLKKLPTYRPDDILVAAVIQALWEDTILRRTEYRQIHVEVENGIAYLSGYVSSQPMSKGAEKAAYKADGIWKVENHLAIDSEMELVVSHAIGEDPRTKNARIFVGVNNGFVTLTGLARGLEGRLAAQEQAVAIPKVRGVLNSIGVPGVDTNTDDQRALQPIIGAGIYATDILIGVVDKVVINPDNRLATAILANAVFPDPTQMGSNWLWNEHRYTERRIIIPINTIRHQSESDIFLKVKSREAAAMKAFDTSSYASPDENWQPPYPYKRADILIVRHAETSRQCA
jgi:osmotically-inducible protein OsmY